LAHGKVAEVSNFIVWLDSIIPAPDQGLVDFRH
jgi:hypothetical protein